MVAGGTWTAVAGGTWTAVARGTSGFNQHSELVMQGPGATLKICHGPTHHYHRVGILFGTGFGAAHGRFGMCFPPSVRKGGVR